MVTVRGNGGIKAWFGEGECALAKIAPKNRFAGAIVTREPGDE